MAARKLQTEIDRTLKKVTEGVELFESIYDKMQASTNQAQKEKLELELKSQIKKLQRLRDQIKTWVASNDIKDKTQLLDNRKLIETQMEKFKACEKEMKTKAFSKEGLIQAAKLDPKEQEKEEATLWLQTQVEELQMQVEQSEAEIESLHGTGKKKNKSGSTAGRLEELETLNERRKWHISRLEIVLRLLNNGSLQTEKVQGLKEDVQYFVESNTEEGFDEDEGIYDDLNLDEEEEKFGLAPEDDDSDDSDVGSEDLPPRPSVKKIDEESVTSSKPDSPILKKAATIQLRKQSIDTPAKPPPNPNFAQQPMASILKAGLPPPIPRPATLPPVRYSVAAAGGSNASASTQPAHGTSSQSSLHAAAPVSASVSPPNPPPIQSTAPSIPPPSISQPPLDQLSGVSSSPSLTHPSTTSPMMSSSASVSHQPDGSFYSGQESPVMSEGVPSSLGGPAATSSPPRVMARKDSISSPPRAGSHSPGVSQLLDPPPSLNGLQAQQPPPSAQAQTAPQFPPGVKVPQSEQAGTSMVSGPQQPSIGAQRPLSASQQPVPQRSTAGAFPGSLSDLVVSFESVKQKAALRMTNLDQVHKMLEGGYSNVPQPQDTEKPKYYVPRNPYPTAAYYPQAPHPLLSTAAIYAQLDVETLFYVFYFLPGTYQQYLAAKELKRQSWRFHVKYLTWFQRHSEPQAITEEYEQGVYVYFDWEGSWCQRKKSDFRFEYRYLSED
ncbi:Not1 N-terminal domain, CCR4-Not complex component-domain-containing protein [Mycena belliarum]|uniref:General negative regulator of transcription subunit n=1 Tax=Mycena belliarum TaxID=1033014 RepID=A0AAD6U7A3_9AGAR|nr:Not1 N-terminal domain, CCR4-Not complex component-domain-containing protein [Mycena belliae]